MYLFLGRTEKLFASQGYSREKAVEMGLQVVDGSSQENLAKGRLGVVEEQCPYYVFSNAEAKGFVIVSGDDRFPEIVGYSGQGTYDEALLPDNFKSYMNAYRAMVEAVNKGNVAATRQLKEVESLRSSVTSTAVSPLLGNIAWGQGSPYNDFVQAMMMRVAIRILLDAWLRRWRKS